MKPEALQELDAEIAYWTEQHYRGRTEAHFAAFGIATGLKMAKSILLDVPYRSPKAAADSFCDQCGTIRRSTDVCPLTGRDDCPPSEEGKK